MQLISETLVSKFTELFVLIVALTNYCLVDEQRDGGMVVKTYACANILDTDLL